MSRIPHAWRIVSRVGLIAAPVAVLIVGAIAVSPLSAQIAVRNQGYIPYADAPIHYRSNDISDPVTLLERKLENGTAKLEFDGNEHGYLQSILKHLDIPSSSQTLVFSKTSFQYPRISPQHPRALYFNDDVYIGVIHEGKELEVVSFDKNQGAIFYILHDQKADSPRFERAELDCTQCHIAAGTRGVPGVLLRSVNPIGDGTLLAGARSYITDQESPLAQRWGGWYAHGQLAQKSMANAVTGNDTDVKSPTLQTLSKDASYDPSGYVEPTSDEVALLVLAHQTQAHNLITLTNYKTRIALHDFGGDAAVAHPPALDALPEDKQDKIKRPAEQLLRYLLFVNEEPLPNLDAKKEIAASAFARDFSARGERDPKGRSLRDFDLHTRIFRYPLSYLVYSQDFDGLPEPAKSYVYSRLLQILQGNDSSGDFEALTADDRRTILEILLATKSGLPQAWLEYAKDNHLQVALRPYRSTIKGHVS